MKEVIIHFLSPKTLYCSFPLFGVYRCYSLQMEESDIAQEVQMDNKAKGSSLELPTSAKNKSLPTIPALTSKYSSKKLRKKGQKGISKMSLHSANEQHEDEIRDNSVVNREEDKVNGTGPVVGASNQVEKEVIFSSAEDNQRPLPNACQTATCQSPVPANQQVAQEIHAPIHKRPDQ